MYLHNLLPNRNSADEVEVVTGLSDNSVSNDVSVNDVSPSDISVPAENSVPVTSISSCKFLESVHS